MSLVEILVVMPLLLLCLGYLVSLLLSALKISARASERMNRQQHHGLAMRRLGSDLQSTVLEAVSVHETSPGRLLATIHRLHQVSPDGGRVWEDALVVYEWDQQLLRRCLYRPSTPPALSATPLQPTQPEAEAFRANSQEESVLLRDVSEMTIRDRDPATKVWEQPLTVTLTQSWDAPGRHAPEVLTLSQKLFLRNP